MARKVKTTPAAATTTTKVEDNKEKVKEVKEVKPVEKTETIKKTKETPKQKKDVTKRKFTVYYNGSVIPGVYIYGQRPKQAATKALNVILKHFFTKDKQFDISAIGKEIKFYIEEVIKIDTTEKVNRFYYKGSKNYIVTEETMKKYESKKVKIEKDKDGIYGIVAEHKGADGSVKKIMHKFVNKVNIDKEATNEAKRKKKEEVKQMKEEQKKIKEEKKKETKKQITEEDKKQSDIVQVKEVKQEDKTEDKKEEVKKTRKRKQQQ